MTLVREHISIEELDSKSYQIRFPGPFEEEKAVLTHYLHNIRNGTSGYYKKQALSVLKNYVEYKNENNSTSVKTEDVLQQFLFEAENVPFPAPENYTFKFIDLFFWL